MPINLTDSEISILPHLRVCARMRDLQCVSMTDTIQENLTITVGYYTETSLENTTAE